MLWEMFILGAPEGWDTVISPATNFRLSTLIIYLQFVINVLNFADTQELNMSAWLGSLSTTELDATSLSAIKSQLDDLEDVIKKIVELEPESAPFLPQISTVRGALDRTIFQVERPTCSHWTSVMFSSMLMDMESILTERAECAHLGPEFLEVCEAATLERGKHGRAHGDPIGAFVFDFVQNTGSPTMARILSQAYFSTEYFERLGLGYQSVAEGDEIWLLKSSAAPAILRPTPQGTYEFVGLTYICGIMDGELEHLPIESRGRAEPRTIVIE